MQEHKRDTDPGSLGKILEEAIATTPVFLLRNSWTDEPCRLLSRGSQRVGHGWSNLAHMRIIQYSGNKGYIHILYWSFHWVLESLNLFVQHEEARPWIQVIVLTSIHENFTSVNLSSMEAALQIESCILINSNSSLSFPDASSLLAWVWGILYYSFGEKKSLCKQRYFAESYLVLMNPWEYIRNRKKVNYLL